MRVLYPIIRVDSGSDVYFRRLNEALATKGVKTYLHTYPWWTSMAPFTIVASPDHGEQLIHTNVDLAHRVKRNGRPVIATAHHSVFDPSFQRGARLLQRAYYQTLLRRETARGYRAADRVVAVSQSTRDDFVRHFGMRDVEVIYNGVDTGRFTPGPLGEGKRLLFVGNLIWRKGADLLPAIMALLGPAFELRYTSGLRTDKRLLGPNLVPLGRLSDEELINEYRRCDMLLFPSRLEGFGYAAAEAMACGKPVVAFANSSIPELVVHGQGGWLAHTGDVTALVKGIREIASNARLREEMGHFNRQRVVEMFSLARCIDEYYQLYHDVTGVHANSVART